MIPLDNIHAYIDVSIHIVKSLDMDFALSELDQKVGH